MKVVIFTTEKSNGNPGETVRGSKGQKAEAAYVNLSPSTLLSPVPVVMVSCAEKGHPEKQNALTLAWAGTVNSEPPMLSVSIRKERYSYAMIREAGEFVVNLVDEGLSRECDFCGVKSGRDVDKAAEAGFHYRPMDGMTIAPAIAGAPLSLGCKTRQVLELGSHDLFIAEIVQVSVRQDLLDEKGSLHLERAGLVAYNHGLYQKLGPVLGFFGWSLAKPEVYRNRMQAYRMPKSTNRENKNKPIRQAKTQH